MGSCGPCDLRSAVGGRWQSLEALCRTGIARRGFSSEMRWLACSDILVSTTRSIFGAAQRLRCIYCKRKTSGSRIARVCSRSRTYGGSDAETEPKTQVLQNPS